MSALKRLLPWLILALLLLLLANVARARPPQVEVVRPQSQDLAEVIALSGRVRGVEESQLAPEIGGTVRRLLVEEGQSVTRGQKVAELDTRRLQASLDQALEAVRVAEAQLDVARRGPLPSQLEQVRSEVEAQRLSAAAALESAGQKLLEAERGPRIEQIQQARALLREATADAEQKARESQRQTRLLTDGAVSMQSAEQAQTAARQAQESVKAARARLSELERGTRPEEIEQARAAVASARADLLAAEQAGQARVQQLLDLPRAEDVKLAEAQLQEARGAARVAQQQLEQTIVLAPYDGVIGRRLLRVGDQAGPDDAIFTFSSKPALEIRVDVDESDRSRLALGLKAEIRASGYAEKFQAELAELSPEVDSVRGTQEARLRPIDGPDWLVPGQTVDVNLILGEQKPHLVLPLTCIVLKGDTAEVAVIEAGTVHKKPVQVSNPTADGYLIRSGLSGQEMVALLPQGLEEGQTVRPVDAR